MIRVLAVDGGGIRGLIPAVVLADIEQTTGRSISSLFDIIAGTSTGGLVAVALALRGANNEPRFSAADLVDLYTDRGREIFHSTFWQKVMGLGGLFADKYAAECLERVLDEYLGDLTLSDVLTNVLIPAYEIELRRPWFFRSWKAQDQPANRDFKLRDVVRATTAAPTYFPPARVHALGLKRPLSLIDGGVFANNPAMCAYVDSTLMYAGEDILVVSLGTGRTRQSILRRRHWGLVHWARSVMGVVFDGVARTVDYQLTQLLPRDRYFRFEVDLQRAVSLDDTRVATIERLRADAEHLVASERRRLRELCQLLTSVAESPAPSVETNPVLLDE